MIHKSIYIYRERERPALAKLCHKKLYSFTKLKLCLCCETWVLFFCRIEVAMGACLTSQCAYDETHSLTLSNNRTFLCKFK